MNIDALRKRCTPYHGLNLSEPEAVELLNMAAKLQSEREESVANKRAYLDLCEAAGAYRDDRMRSHAEIKSSVEYTRRLRDAIDELRQEEGEAVQIPNDNADFDGPNNVVIWHRDFEDDAGTSFTGKTVLECLENAVAARSKLKEAMR